MKKPAAPPQGARVPNGANRKASTENCSVFLFDLKVQRVAAKHRLPPALASVIAELAYPSIDTWWNA